jgi:predicted class III extradiol MEMO1 family dioxygenase
MSFKKKKRTLRKKGRYPVLLIPHPGYEYGGFARKKVFTSMKKQKRIKIKQIAYISAYHNKQVKLDHSYTWVKKELNLYFPNAEHIVYAPQSWGESEQIAKQLLKKHCLIIGTTDLMHYGERYNYTDNLLLSGEKRRQWKMKMEKPFLRAIMNISSERMKQLYIQNPHLACGPYSVYCILRYMELENRQRKAIIKAYYDSLESKYVKNKHRREKELNFVSYISIVFE